MSTYRLVSEAQRGNSNQASNPQTRRKGRKKAIPLNLVFGQDNSAPVTDILAPYFQSKLPPPEDFGLHQEDFPSLSADQKATIQGTADQIIERALNHLCCKGWTQHLLLKCDDILSLQAGGNPEGTFRAKLKVHGVIKDMKVFPRHSAVAVTFTDKRDAAQAYHALNGQKLMCNEQWCSYMKEFPNKERLLGYRLGIPRDTTVSQSAPDMAAPVITAVPAVTSFSARPPEVSGTDIPAASQCAEADEYLESLLDF